MDQRLMAARTASHTTASYTTAQDNRSLPVDAYLQMQAKLNQPGFVEDIDKIGEDIKSSLGWQDYRQLRKFERWGRLCTFFGYATAWLIPNPISAYLISQGNYARWSLIFHQVSHGAMDRIANVPARYTSKQFARKSRRTFDWLDWITPHNWHIEHNQLHHYHLGSDQDPDVVARNAKFIRDLRAPLFFRYALAALVAAIWKPFYYAPNTMMEARYQSGRSETNQISWRSWSPSTAEGRELWLTSLLPYGSCRFVFIPLLFYPLGLHASLSVLANSVLAEVLTNLHSFLTIGPNHTGDDIYIFKNSSKSRADFYLRQILGTVNFPAGSDVVDFLYGGMNYQVEHHLWPNASIYQYKRVRPQLIELCRRHGITYLESSWLARVKKTFQLMAGASVPRETNLN
jgi:fatty acid desaturase